MSLLALRYFLEIANTLNISKAARNLNISQPGLSQQIAALENRLGFQLLRRTTRKITLTEEGEYLFRKLQPSFQHIEYVLRSIQESGTIPEATIKITAVPSAASIWVPKLLKRLKATTPDFRFIIQETTSMQAIHLVERMESDIAFIRTPIDAKQAIRPPLEMIEFTKHPLMLVVASDHPAAGQAAVDLYEMRHEMFLHYDANHSPSLHSLLKQACLAAGFVPNTTGVGPELLTLANLIASGLGVTLMPNDMASLLVTYPIRVIPLAKQRLDSSISAVWNTEGYHPLHVRQALAALPLFAAE
ncbi:LysR family transcriptional regulator [Paenibacillus faecalis]|uniref:LysR family transcriptional regulator n=1 Tax=Paenibacillus faecalis TaxID=2079532 RepID=UPI00131A5BAA|nr:LysR family transcriptional regulator [Paenibacillus faecalis]